MGDDSEKNKGKKNNTTRVRSFADDTRVNKKIRDERDMEEMQRDLEIIYEWAILFVIMISDIDKEINKRYKDQNNKEEKSEEIIEKPQDDSEKNEGKKTNTTRVRSFADDTRVNKKIRDERDM